jgi:hypothetical protein
MKYRAKWLDVPGLSQGNEKNQDASRLWCGRTSAAMIYNYYQKVAGASDPGLIENKQGVLPPHDLVYPDGAVVGQTTNSASGYDLHSVLEKGVAGWERVQLYPASQRTASVPGEDEIRTILASVTDSLEANNPILFASGISRGHKLANGTIVQTRHLVVICGYRVNDDGSLWLLIKDPATMIEGTEADPQKVRLLGQQNIQVLDPGAWYQQAAHYWLRAARLFQKNERSTDPSDLWCDHSDLPGFTVEVNTKAKTVESPFSHAETGFAFPVSIRSSVTAANIQAHFKETERTAAGNYPLGSDGVWHGGVHLLSKPGTAVVASATGSVVAARLAPDEAHAYGHYGSHNFILMRHEVKGAFLNGVEGRRSLAKLVVETADLLLRSEPRRVPESAVATLHRGDELEVTDPSPVTADGYNWITVKVAASSDPDHAGKEGVVAFHPQLVRAVYDIERVFDPEEVVPFFSLFMHLAAVPLEEGNPQLKDMGWLAKPFLEVQKEASLRAKPDGAVLANLKAGTLVEETSQAPIVKKKVRWLHVTVVSSLDPAAAGSSGYVADNLLGKVTRPDPQLLRQLAGGGIVNLNQATSAGDPLWFSGEYGSRGYRTGLVHWEFFSEKNLFPKWKQAEDLDEDFSVDCKPLLEQVDAALFATTGVHDTRLTREEVTKFYQGSGAASIRHWACRFMSEWAVDLDAALPKMKQHWFTGNLKENYGPYLWWAPTRAAGVPLPQDARVWHYNPIAVLEALTAPVGVDGKPDTALNQQL